VSEERFVSASALTAPQARFVAHACGQVRADERFSALLAGGSWIGGRMDRHSDVDLVLIVEDASFEAVMAEREAFAARLGELLACFTGEHVGEPRLLICLYGPELLHVDLKFATASDLDERVERPIVLFARDPAAIEARLDAARITWPNASPDWFERRAWIWLHYAATKLARGEYFEAIAMLGYFREQVLGPMLHRQAGHEQRGVRRVESLGREAIAALEATLATHDAASVREALLAAIDLYVLLRDEVPPSARVARMPEALREFILGDTGHGRIGA
jgi:hypothetical protein